MVASSKEGFGWRDEKKAVFSQMGGNELGYDFAGLAMGGSTACDSTRGHTSVVGSLEDQGGRWSPTSIGVRPPSDIAVGLEARFPSVAP